MEIPFVGPSYVARSRVISVQETINWFPEMTPDGKTVSALICTPGLSLFVTASGNGVCRGLYSSAGGRLFGVFGSWLLEFSTAGVESYLGKISTSTGKVNFSENETQLIIVDGTAGYILTLATNAWATITDAHFPNGATHVTNIDGYFIVNEVNSGRFWWSASRDGTSWSGTDFATAEGSPDNLEGLTSCNGQLWLLGSRTSETWYDTGDSSNLFLRVPGAVTQKGCAAKHSIATMAGSVFWVGSSQEGIGTVWMSQGYEAVRISTYAIEYDLARADITDAIGFCYTQEGHAFYVLTFEALDKTYVFDITTGQWHRRGYWSDTEQHRVKYIYQTYFNGKNYVGDRDAAKVYELSLDTYTDNGSVIRRERTAQHIHSDRKRLYFQSFELDMDRGQGLVTGQGSDPQIMLQYSDYGGETWSNEHWTDSGEKGKYKTRVLWRRLGYSRDRVFKVAVTDPVKSNIVGATVQVEAEI